MSTKERLSASVDEELLDAAHQAVAAGRAPSVSAWVNEALTRQLLHDRRMAALADFVREYEAEHGEITGAEVEEVTRRSRARAVVVRGQQSPSQGARASRRGRT